MGIGHPFYVNSPYGITLAHNGNLVNTKVLQAELLKEWRHINTGSDSEVLLNIFASELINKLTSCCLPQKLSNASDMQEEDLIHAAKAVNRRCVGGFAVVAMRAIAGREGQGFSDEIMVASESGVLNAQGFELVGDVPAGHALLVSRDGQAKMFNCMPQGLVIPFAPCVFEYVYFARPDSVLDGVSVYRSRLRMGSYLARKILKDWPDHDIDVVIPVPDTSRTCALECAATLGIKYREGFIKNRYVGRTFIMPAQASQMDISLPLKVSYPLLSLGTFLPEHFFATFVSSAALLPAHAVKPFIYYLCRQGLRKKSVRQKLSPITSEFQSRNILLVDDSIVRGTTAGEIIQMVRDAGARNVYMAALLGGIDMPTKEELLAHSHTDTNEIAKNSIVDEARAAGSDLKALDCSCFNGTYVTELGADYLANLALRRTSDRGDVRVSASNTLDTLQATTPLPSFAITTLPSFDVPGVEIGLEDGGVCVAR
ncbi:MAG: hypothetical protein SGPRY_010271 [Prymnesium sp.]